MTVKVGDVFLADGEYLSVEQIVVDYRGGSTDAMIRYRSYGPTGYEELYTTLPDFVHYVEGGRKLSEGTH